MRRNSGVRVCCVCALTEATPAVDDDIDTESNSTISQADSETTVVPTMTDLQLTVRLYRRLTRERPVSVNGKLPTLDDVRALITAGFSACNDLWKVTAPKKVVSRSVTRRCQLLHIYDRRRLVQAWSSALITFATVTHSAEFLCSGPVSVCLSRQSTAASSMQLVSFSQVKVSRVRCIRGRRYCGRQISRRRSPVCPSAPL